MKELNAKEIRSIQGGTSIIGVIRGIINFVDSLGKPIL